MNATVKTAAPAVTIKKTGKHFEAPSEPVTVVAATPDVGHKIPAPKKAPAIVVPTGIALTTERAGRFAFTTAATVPVVIPGWDKIEADTPDTSIGADAAVTYLKNIGPDAAKALVAKLFPKTPKATRTVSVRVSRATITDEDLLTLIRGHNLTDARIQVILDTVRENGFSASQPRVDKLLGRVTA